MKYFLGVLVLKYLRFWSKLQLKKYAPDIIGITGSAGKTSCRNAVTAILMDKYQLKVTGKANSESGIPLDILGITPTDFSIWDWLRMIILAPIKLLTNWRAYEKYVVEMGIDSYKPPKNMDYLLSIVRPRTAIFLNALPVHSQAFDVLVETKGEKRREEIARVIAEEKGKLIKSLPSIGLAILNADQPEIMEFTKKTNAQVMTFGQSNQADIRVISVVRNEKGTIFEFKDKTETARVILPYLLPDYFGLTFGAALCINADEGNSLAEGSNLLTKNYKLEPGRMSLFNGVNGSLIIDSSYNSSAEPAIGALKMLKTIEAKRRFAILGNMNELGEEAESEMKRVMEVARSICDEVVRVGPGLMTAAKAGEYLKNKLAKGDVVLIKGSQNGVFLETTVEMLLADKSDAKKLCRRGKYWDTQRKLVVK